MYAVGILLKIMTFVLFSVNTLLLEQANFSTPMGSGFLPPLMYKSLAEFGTICVVGTLLLGGVIYQQGLSLTMSKKSLGVYGIRSVVSIVAMVTFIASLRLVGSGTATLLGYATPLIALLVLRLLNEEPFVKLAFLGNLVSLGVLVGYSFYQSMHYSGLGIILGLISAMGWAVYDVIVKIQTRSEHFLVQTFVIFALTALLLLPFSAMNLMNLSVNDWLMYGLIALVRILNIVCLFVAISYATLTWLTPIAYIRYPLIALANYWIYNHHLALNDWLVVALLILVNGGVVMGRYYKPTPTKP